LQTHQPAAAAHGRHEETASDDVLASRASDPGKSQRFAFPDRPKGTRINGQAQYPRTLLTIAVCYASMRVDLTA